MTTREQIQKIVKDQYRNFNGRRMAKLKILHSSLREKISDEEYLELLKKCQEENPRPVYQSPLIP